MPAIRAAALGRSAGGRQRFWPSLAFTGGMIGRPTGCEMPLQPRHRLIQHLLPLAEREAGVMPWRVRRIVEGGDRDGGHACLLGDMPAERHIASGKAQRREVGGDEVAAMGGRQYGCHPEIIANDFSKLPTGTQVSSNVWLLYKRCRRWSPVDAKHRA